MKLENCLMSQIIKDRIFCYFSNTESNSMSPMMNRKLLEHADSLGKVIFDIVLHQHRI